MSEKFPPGQDLFVILTKPHEPAGMFTTDLGDGRIAACIFTQREHAMLFAMNAQGLDISGVTAVDCKTLREALATEKRNGITHVLLDPSAGSGSADDIPIDTFLGRIAA